MDWPENLLILLGISLDIFAGMECKGSLLAKIEKKTVGTGLCSCQRMAGSCLICRKYSFHPSVEKGWDSGK